MFLLPGVVIAWYVTETPIPLPVAVEMRNYLFARQHPDDGGWGLHIEGESTAYGTVMTYVVLRLLGAEEEDKRMITARGMLHQLGGAVMAPHWAKFWLAVLGVIEWQAVNPVPPELWYVNHQYVNTHHRHTNFSLQAYSRLGSNRSVAMVDSYAPGVSPYVLYLFYKMDVPSEFTRSSTA